MMQSNWHNSQPSHQLAVNPLVAASEPFIILASELRAVIEPPELTQLYTKLCKDIKSFENKARMLGYRSEVILAARYFICAFIDESILITRWGKQSSWQKRNLLNTFLREDANPNRFFTILQRAMQSPKIYIDALELGYLCLSLGYLGSYQQKATQNERSIIFDDLYEIITQTRGEFPKDFLITHSSEKKIKSYFNWHLPPVWLTAIVTIILLVIIFIPYYQHLEEMAKPLQKMTKILGQLNEKEQ